MAQAKSGDSKPSGNTKDQPNPAVNGYALVKVTCQRIKRACTALSMICFESDVCVIFFVPAPKNLPASSTPSIYSRLSWRPVMEPSKQ
eukprot:3499849-Amphidinium_carterae.1